MADSDGVRRPRRGIAWLASKARHETDALQAAPEGQPEQPAGHQHPGRLPQRRLEALPDPTVPRATAGRPAGNGPGRSGGAARRSRAGAPAARHPWTAGSGSAPSGNPADSGQQADDPDDQSAMIPARQPAQARSGNRAPQEGRERAKNLLWAAGRLAGHRSRSAPVHQGGGAGCGSSAGLVCEGPCTGGAASLTLAWRAVTASRVTLKTVRSWLTVTGPV